MRSARFFIISLVVAYFSWSITWMRVLLMPLREKPARRVGSEATLSMNDERSFSLMVGAMATSRDALFSDIARTLAVFAFAETGFFSVDLAMSFAFCSIAFISGGFEYTFGW